MASNSAPNDRMELRVEEGVAEIRLTFPEKRNCFSAAFIEDFNAVVGEIRDRSGEDVFSIAVTAEGPVFSSGADTDRVTDPDAADPGDVGYEGSMAWLREGPVPVVTGARGAAVGAGAGLLRSGDFRIATPSLEIWWPETQYGLPSLTLIPKIAPDVGVNRALEMALLGRDGSMTGEEAHALGFVTRLAPDGELEDRTRELALTLSEYDQRYGIASEFLAVRNRVREGLTAPAMTFARRRSDRLPSLRHKAPDTGLQRSE